MMDQSNRVRASLRNGPWLVSSVLSYQRSPRLNRFVQLARKKTLNYLGDLSLLASVWLARYMVWREIRRKRPASKESWKHE